MPLGKWAGQLEEIRTPSIGRLREFVCYENTRQIDDGRQSIKTTK